MATELSRELFPDDILWFLQDMERETIDEVDTLIRQIEVNTDEQPLSSTQQATRLERQQKYEALY